MGAMEVAEATLLSEVIKTYGHSSTLSSSSTSVPSMGAMAVPPPHMQAKLLEIFGKRAQEILQRL